MPFGLKNAPATFQRIINQCLSGLIGSECLVYLDDIVIYSYDFFTHMIKLEKIFQRLREHKFLVQLDKSEFCKTEINYLGYVISDAGIQPNPEKIKCIKNFPAPTNVKQIQQFLGLTGYYRRFINHYSDLMKPLTLLLKKDTPFQWSKECENSFQKLITLLTEDLLLKYPDFSKLFFLNTDASNFALGAVLTQKSDSSEILLPIAYASRTLNKAEINYSTIEKELLAIIWAVKYFRPYLFGREFTILSDHKPLQWLFNVNDPGSRLLRWRLKLAEYNYKIQHISGHQNIIADTLSRIQLIQTRSKRKKFPYIKFPNISLADTQNIAIFTSPDIMTENFLVSNLELTVSKKGEFEIIKTQRHTIFIILYRQSKYEPFSQANFLSILHNLSEKLNELKITEIGLYDDINTLDLDQKSIIEPKIAEVLYPIKPSWLTLGKIPTNVNELIKLFHEHHLIGHQGSEKTYRTLLDQNFYWIGMKKDIKKFIKTCQECQILKPNLHPHKHAMIITDTASEPLEKVSIDIVGPLTLTEKGNRFIFTLQDNLTKFLFAKALPCHTASMIVETLLEFFAYFGIPKNILSDNGSDFCAEITEKLFSEFKIQHVKCTPYHPKSNGARERAHGPLKQYFAFYANELNTDWDIFLHLSVFSYNTSIHSSTQFSPYLLMFRRKPFIPITIPKKLTYEEYLFQIQNKMKMIQEEVRSNQIAKKQATKSRVDEKAHKIPPHYKPGDKVLLKKPQYKNPLGPYTIKSVDLPNIELEINGKTRKYHAKLLKPFFSVTIIFFFMLFSLVCGIDPITPITSKSGLFFQNLGIVKNHIDDWHLVTYFNLSQIQEKINTLMLIESKIVHYETTYNKTKLSPSLQNNTNSILNDFETLQTTVENTRIKRGIFNGGSYALKWLFGTPDSDDAEYYSKSLHSLKSDVNRHEYLMSHQIQIINNTINNFEANNAIFQKNQRVIQNILQIIANQSGTPTYVSELKIFNDLQILFDHFDQIYYRKIQTLQNAILYAKRDIVHPAILNPRKLKEVPSLAHLPHDRTFPLSLSVLHVSRFFDLSTVHTEFRNQQLFFIIELPLIELTLYELYKLLPFPFLTESHIYSYFSPSHSYLITDPTRIKTVLLDDLETCKQMTNNETLCTISAISRDHSCEAKILAGLQPHCNLSSFAAIPSIWYFLKNNQWLFVQSKTDRLLIDWKNGSTTYYNLPSTGILTLPPNAIGYTSSHILIPKTVYNPTPLFHPLSTFSYTIPSNVNVYLPTSYSIPTLNKMDLVTFHRLSTELQSLQQTNEYLKSTDPEGIRPSILHWSIGGSSFTLLMIGAICVGYYIFRKRQQSSQPAPVQVTLQPLPPPTNQHVVPVQVLTTSIPETPEIDKAPEAVITHPIAATRHTRLYPPFDVNKN